MRTGNTLEAIAAARAVGCLTNQERSILEENYTFLRKIEHRLQIMFDLQTHLLPEEPRRTAQAGHADGLRRHATSSRPLDAFEADYQQQDRAEPQDSRSPAARRLQRRRAQTEPEVDLVLDPDPAQEQIAEVLGKYRFHDVDAAYRNLMALADEKIRFLSTRRCRHFLAAIAPRLLAAIAATPDPDSTLVNLSKVSDSLGGKGVLWELFSFNPPSLELYVELCASSPICPAS